MPEELDDCVKKVKANLIAEGVAEEEATSRAFAICQESLKCAGTGGSSMKWIKHVPLSKVEVFADRVRVTGILAEEVPDKSKPPEIMDYAVSKPNFEKWSAGIEKGTGGLSKGNLRAMHGKVSAGILTKIEFDDAERNIPISADVIDQNEMTKVLAGCYTGFSMGGDYGKIWKDPDFPNCLRYEAIPNEASLADNPAMYGSSLEVQKLDGTKGLIKIVGAPPFKFTPELLAKLAENGTLLKKDRAPFVKTAEEAVVAANQAIAFMKETIAKFALMEGDPDTFTLDDMIMALDRFLFAKETAAMQAADPAKAGDTAGAGETGGAEPPAAPTPTPAPTPAAPGMAATTKPGDLAKVLADTVKAAMDEKELTAEGLAAKVAGVTTDTIEAILNGEKPNDEALEGIAPLLGLEADALKAERDGAEDEGGEGGEGDEASKVVLVEMRKIAEGIGGSLRELIGAIKETGPAEPAPSPEKVTFTERLKKAEEALGSLEKIEERLEVVESRPAAVGTRLTPAEKAAAAATGLTGQTPESLGKALESLLIKGVISKEQDTALRMELAQTLILEETNP